ncbi:hypothetical protein WICPIJ_004598 [Wickerhamomyces pijperi]|uniref:Mitochondrial distribution and morphology protein 34 n=1 Tax=Wickerhamomyces pijperi TaxID=599730 RepID=A0A9P8Q5K4_WICPI|nr:hypothetical protein WICPIJ_004598 [Wickerhamomyces pijperi]
MSCDIKWDFDKKSMESWSKELLNDALNSNTKSNFLTSKIDISDLNFGDIAPELEILEIGDLANDKFRGIFKIKYYGNSSIELKTSIQANLLNIYEKNVKDQTHDFALPKFKLARESFSVPLLIKLSQIEFSGIIIMVFSKTKGLTLVFKNDPLENIKVESSFQNVEIVENFVQKKIETLMRDLFREILPSVLNQLSQKYITSNKINQLYQHQTNKTKPEKKVLLSEINTMDPELSPVNMLRLSTLIKSRQSFSLSIPAIEDVVQRQNLHKFTNQNEIFKKKINIQYLNKFINHPSMNNTVVQISKIQSNFYSNESNNKSTLKKRKIKLFKKEKQPATEEHEEDPTTEKQAVSKEQPTLAKKEEVCETTLQLPSTKSTNKESIESVSQFAKLDRPCSPIIDSIPYQHVTQFYNRPASPMKSSSSASPLHFTNTSLNSPSVQRAHNLMKVGLGNHHSNLWPDAPPPYIS